MLGIAQVKYPARATALLCYLFLLATEKQSIPSSAQVWLNRVQNFCVFIDFRRIVTEYRKHAYYHN